MIPRLPESLERSIIIGVDGLGGSGKTTYARELKQSIQGAHLFHLDDFIHPKNIRYNDGYEEWICYYQLQWRYEYLISELLAPLKNGLEVKCYIELYDKETDSYKEQAVEIPRCSTVIIEGVFLQRPELRAYFDYVLFLDVDRKSRLERVLNRDTYIGRKEDIIGKYERRYFPAEDVYMGDCNPLLLADYIQKTKENFQNILQEVRNSMKIIKATVQDAPVIHDIMIQAFLKYQNENPPSSALDETVRTVSEGLQNGEQAFICYVEDQPAGMVRFRIEVNSIYFFRLAVIPERHGQGIAKRLLNYLEDFAKQQNMHELLCKVRMDVPENIQLYQSIGYHVYEETIVKRADGASVPVVAMEKPLC